jgi:hypothetical protein
MAITPGDRPTQWSCGESNSHATACKAVP